MALSLLGAASAWGQRQAEDTQQYIVYGVYNESQRTQITGTGAAIDAVGSDWVEISATPEAIAAIRALGYKVEPISLWSQGSKF
jgi:type II secretory pathway pseudopilin PulG